jgi:outer membrane protein assembly factor BamB
MKSWSGGGPKLVWKAPYIGGGYGSVAVTGGRIYGAGYRGNYEDAWALEEKSAKGLWVTHIAEANTRVGSPEGTRSTPTVDGDRVYVMGVSGDLVCLSAANGQILWRKNMVRDFGGSVPSWGYSESPLVDGEKVIATPGGRQATLVALNKMTGALIWAARVPEGDGAQYSSCIVAEVGGVRQYVQFLQRGVVGVAARDGRFLWRYSHPANTTANCSTPIFHDGCVFAASSYNTGGGLVRLVPTGGGISAQEVYFTRQMKNHHGGMILVGDYLYGFDEGTLTCLNFKTGQIAWTHRSVGKGSLAYADGHLYARGESRGTVALVEATPSGYVEKGRFDQPDRSGKNAWPHPVIANGRLYLRDQDNLFAYDVKGG